MTWRVMFAGAYQQQAPGVVVPVRGVVRNERRGLRREEFRDKERERGLREQQTGGSREREAREIIE